MSDNQSELEPFGFSLAIGAEVLNFNGSLPAGPCAVDALMPLVLALGQGILDAVERQMDAGKKVSCGPRCGACCRQLVPVSESEAAYLRNVVIPGLEKEHRERVEMRIEEARVNLSGNGLLELVKTLPAEKDAGKRQSLGLRYFASGIACPFLEQESCSIHPQRPLACREYLVTSPPACCGKPSEGGVDPVRLPVKPSHALIRMDAEGAGRAGWETMIAALTEDHSLSSFSVDDPAEFLRNFISKLA